MFPRLFTIGNFGLPTYGLLVAIGVLVGLTVSVAMARRQDNPSGDYLQRAKHLSHALDEVLQEKFHAGERTA